MQRQESIESEIKNFKAHHGYEPDLENPRSFNEKICRKKLYDRNPLLTLTADKYRARDYIRSKIGWEAEEHLIPLLWVGKDYNKIPWDKIGDTYIIKPNNGAGRWILREGNIYSNTRNKPVEDMRQSEIMQVIRDWFKTVHGAEWNEWCYQNIDPLIVIEKVLYDGEDLVLNYKFMMFSGKCRMIYVLDRNDIHLTMYDENFNLLPVKRKGHPAGVIGKKPYDLRKIIGFAEKLSQPFDFVRVDFYITDDWFYFGEMTHYPGSGHGVFEPADYDLTLGGYWK